MLDLFVRLLARWISPTCLHRSVEPRKHFPYHTYRGEPLFLSYMCYLYSLDQTNNPDKMLSSLLADPASIHIKLTMGGPPTSDVCLQQKAPFCFSRHDSINNSQPHLGSIPLYLCNHTSHLSFGSRYCFGSIAFSGRFPSASEDTSLVWGSANKYPERLLFTIDSSFCLLTPGIFFLCGTTTYLCLPTN